MTDSVQQCLRGFVSAHQHKLQVHVSFDQEAFGHQANPHHATQHAAAAAAARLSVFKEREEKCNICIYVVIVYFVKRNKKKHCNCLINDSASKQSADSVRVKDYDGMSQYLISSFVRSCEINRIKYKVPVQIVKITSDMSIQDLIMRHSEVLIKIFMTIVSHGNCTEISERV